MRANNREDVVAQFHKVFKAPLDEEWSNDNLSLRLRLMKEEMKEIEDEIKYIITVNTLLSKCSKIYEPAPEEKAKLLKEMADLQYVLSGTAVALGLDLQTAFNRVHASNMSKLDDDGKPIFREDGKVLKGPNYKEPDLLDLVA